MGIIVVYMLDTEACPTPGVSVLHIFRVELILPPKLILLETRICSFCF